MKRSVLNNYKKFCDVNHQQATSESREAGDRVERAELELNREVQEREAFEQLLARRATQGVTSAEWRLLESQRQLLAQTVATRKRSLMDGQRALNRASAALLEARTDVRRAEKLQERQRTALRQREERFQKREADEVGGRLKSVLAA